MFEELALARADGRYLKLIALLAKVEVLVLDDWGLAPLDDERRRDLLGILDGGRFPKKAATFSRLSRFFSATLPRSSTP